MPLSDISFDSPARNAGTFDPGRGAFQVTTDQIVKAIDRIRDILTGAQWRPWRGLVGTGGIDFPLGVPDASTPIIPGINEFVCTIEPAAVPATLQEANPEPYLITAGANLLQIKINDGPAQTITLTSGASQTAEQVADDIALQLDGAVPFVWNNAIHLSTIATGLNATIEIIDIPGSARTILGWPKSPAVAKGVAHDPWIVQAGVNDTLKVAFDGAAPQTFVIPEPPLSLYGLVTAHWLFIEDLLVWLNNGPTDTPPGIGPMAGGTALNHDNTLWIESNTAGLTSSVEIFHVPTIGLIEPNIAPTLGLPIMLTNVRLAFSGANKGPHALSYYFWNHHLTLTHPDYGLYAVWVDVSAAWGALVGLVVALDGGIGSPKSVNPHPQIAEVTGVHTIGLRGWGGGSFSDFMAIAGNGAIDLVGGFAGGGWELRSRAQQDDDPTSNNVTHIHVKVLSRTSGQPGLEAQIWENSTLRFTFQPQYTPTLTPFHLWANPYGLVFENSEPFHAGDIYVGNAFLIATSTRVDPANTTVVRHVVILYGFGVRSDLGISNAFANAIIITDTRPSGMEYVATGNAGGSLFSFCYYNYVEGGGLNLETRTRQSFLLPARVFSTYSQFSPSNPKPARIVGHFWDTFLDSRFKPVEIFITQEGKSYRSLIAQPDNNVATLYVKWPRVASDKGGGNQLLKEGYVGTVGTAVHWIEDDPFDDSMVSNPIFISGIEYTVFSVSDPHNLTLYTSAGNQDRASYQT